MEPTTDDSGIELNAGVVRKVLVDFLRDAFKTSGFQKGVIGLSGGVDSSLVAYLVAEAIGAENVLGVMMPYRTSSPGSAEDGDLVARNLGIRSRKVDISPMVDSHLERIAGDDRVRSGNVMARERMIVLYDLSSEERALVVGTSNKTEILLGYGTLFGDTACAMNPIGDLYKTQVWQLAGEVGVPKQVIDKPPSADLWAGQSDENELGFTYKDVDRLLYYMIDERRDLESLEKLGFSKDFVQKVQNIVRTNQFKRRPALIAKVSGRTANVDFRYPRDWGI